MFNIIYETNLVSQLLDLIDNHLKTMNLSIKENNSSIKHPDDNNDDYDDEIWLSSHRSIFSSYGSHCQKSIPSFHNSQYEDFHWDLYETHNYHQFAFENNQKNVFEEKSLSEWSMDLNLNDRITSSDRPQTSWHEIKNKSSKHNSLLSNNVSHSDLHLSNPLELYQLFQRTKSKQHPCYLYDNFSDKSVCDSVRLLSCSNSITQHQQKTMFIGKMKEESRTYVDQCLQTSTILHPQNVNYQLTKPSQPSFKPHYSLPNLDFLTHYAKENPTSLPKLTNQTKQFCTSMKGTLSEPLSLMKKATCTIFYFTFKSPHQSTIDYPSLSTVEKLQMQKVIKRNQNMKICANKISKEENEPLSSTCSSVSSSGYFSNSSTNQPHHIQTVVSPHPLKSCLKRTKNEQLIKSPSITKKLDTDISKDIITLSDRFIPNENHLSKTRRHSAPISPSNEQNHLLKFRTKTKTCTFSEHDLHTKKNVSFCDEIVRRLITPSTSLNDSNQDYCDLIPHDYLTESPPNEFNLSDEEQNEDQVINFIETLPDNLGKALSIKNQNDKYLIDAFAITILNILEIKCNDPKSNYLNNQTNHDLDRIIRQNLCPLLREILNDGLREYSGSLFSKKMNLWRLIDLTTLKTSQFYEAKMKALTDISASADWIEKFNSFTYHLLNLHGLASWFSHFVSNRALSTYYESSAFIIVNSNNDLFECITNQLEKLSPLQFRLKYKLVANSKILTTNQRQASSTLMKKFNVGVWLRDRKTQAKISPKEPSVSSTKSIASVLTNNSSRRKPNSMPVSGKR